MTSAKMAKLSRSKGWWWQLRLTRIGTGQRGTAGRQDGEKLKVRCRRCSERSELEGVMPPSPF